MNKLRVTGGTWRGRRLHIAPRTRPTSERVRESLFSIVDADLQDSRVLDLFCGSGLLGIEALSRGACGAAFVDAASSSVRTTRRNLAEVIPSSSARQSIPVVRRRLPDEHLPAPWRETFDLVFADPPYSNATPLLTIAQLCLQQLVPGGLVVLEAARRHPHTDSLAQVKGWGGEPGEICGVDVQRRDYGDTCLLFARRGSEERGSISAR